MQKLLKRVYESIKLTIRFKIISHVCVALGVAAWALLLVLCYMEDKLFALKVAACGAVPFVLVSVFRHLIDAPRPYELYDFYDEPPKNKKGKSFPSRHVFSAFLIAALWVIKSPVIAASLAVFGVILAINRVITGIHFVRDVVAGAIIGIVSGVLGILIVL